MLIHPLLVDHLKLGFGQKLKTAIFLVKIFQSCFHLPIFLRGFLFAGTGGAISYGLNPKGLQKDSIFDIDNFDLQ